jgi:hypothetical protein
MSKRSTNSARPSGTPFDISTLIPTRMLEAFRSLCNIPFACKSFYPFAMNDIINKALGYEYGVCPSLKVCIRVLIIVLRSPSMHSMTRDTLVPSTAACKLFFKLYGSLFDPHVAYCDLFSVNVSLRGIGHTAYDLSPKSWGRITNTNSRNKKLAVKYYQYE